jgi:putative ABC transport system substrate-binding protein
MDRRRFLLTSLAGALAGPRAAEAQQAGKVYRIGFLSAISPTALSRSAEAFRQGLHELRWVEGQNFIIDYRYAEGRFDRLADLAAELVRLKVDVIVAGATPVAVAAQNATGTIPIVMFGVGDPVGLGLIASLARPGGNVTGLAFSVGLDTFGKGLELLKEALPKVRRVAVLSNPANPAHAGATSNVKVVA